MLLTVLIHTSSPARSQDLFIFKKAKSEAMVMSRRIMVVFGLGILICMFLLKANAEPEAIKCASSANKEGLSYHAHEECTDHEDNKDLHDDFDDTYKIVKNVAISL